MGYAVPHKVFRTRASTGLALARQVQARCEKHTKAYGRAHKADVWCSKLAGYGWSNGEKRVAFSIGEQKKGWMIWSVDVSIVVEDLDGPTFFLKVSDTGGTPPAILRCLKSTYNELVDKYDMDKDG